MLNNINEISTEKYDKFDSILSVVEFIRNNYNKNHSIQYYAGLCNLDRYYFIKLFKECTGESPHLFKTKIRIEKAKELLCNTNMNNTQIAERIGYSSSYYFSRIFKAYTGEAPEMYRKNHKI